MRAEGVVKLRALTRLWVWSWSKGEGLFRNYVTLFRTFPDPPLVIYLVSSLGLPPPIPLPLDDVIYEWAIDKSQFANHNTSQRSILS